MEPSRFVTDPDGEFHLRMGKDGLAAQAPLRVGDVLQSVVKRQPGAVALTLNSGSTITWSTYYEECRKFAKALISIDFKAHKSVNIIGFNSPEWFFADVGCILAGGIAAGIYTTNGPEACKYIAEHSEAEVVVCENKKHLDKFLKIRGDLPNLKKLVVWDATAEEVAGLDNVHLYKDFIALGASVDDSALEARMSAQKAGHCCTLIYTSGTTGNPKAVMMSHDNVTWTAKVVCSDVELSARDRLVSFLPLSHIAAQMVDIHGPMAAGAKVFFARPDALRGSLTQTLQAVRPTILLGVPRVWEKIEEKMKDIGAKSTGLKKVIANWAKNIGLYSGYRQQQGKSKSFWYFLAKGLVFNKVRKALGLDECRGCFTAAAPITRDTLEFFMSLGITVFEVYGMSESGGPQTISLPHKYELGKCGPCMTGSELKIDNPDKDGDGEICMRGRNIFMGYMKNPEASAETVDEEGFLHSGDVGRIDERGLLKITGRIKELLITAGGENVAPVPIEDCLKNLLPEISNVMVIGDKQKFLTCVITARLDPTEEGTGFTDKLSSTALRHLRNAGINATTVGELKASEEFKKRVEQIIETYNKHHAVSNAQTLKKFVLLSTDFSIDGNELTPTMKLKRRIVLDKYGDDIKSMYGETWVN